MLLARVVSLPDGVTSLEDFEGMQGGPLLVSGSTCEAAGLRNRRGSRFWIVTCSFLVTWHHTLDLADAPSSPHADPKPSESSTTVAARNQGAIAAVWAVDNPAVTVVPPPYLPIPTLLALTATTTSLGLPVPGSAGPGSSIPTRNESDGTASLITSDTSITSTSSGSTSSTTTSTAIITRSSTTVSTSSTWNSTFSAPSAPPSTSSSTLTVTSPSSLPPSTMLTSVASATSQTDSSTSSSEGKYARFRGHLRLHLQTHPEASQKRRIGFMEIIKIIRREGEGARAGSTEYIRVNTSLDVASLPSSRAFKYSTALRLPGDLRQYIACYVGTVG
ncbi:hypothetical protein IW261DRAFT_1606590, partial [Armillaria novae-zelandiae]